MVHVERKNFILDGSQIYLLNLTHNNRLQLQQKFDVCCFKHQYLYLDLQSYYTLYYQKSIMKSLILVIFLLSLALTNDCGGNCPSGKCPTCFCGTTKNMQDITAWCSKYKWDQKCCKCIVSNASGGNANALNYNPNGSYDAGLFQINNINWGSCTTGKAPCDPNINLGCAIKEYEWANNTWKAWPNAKACGC